MSTQTAIVAAYVAMRAIFISYRRDDAEGEAGRLFDDLAREFGAQSVFMDVAAIQPGLDFRKAIDESVATCGVLLAMIGANWLEARNEAGERRLDDPEDFVRLETASALKRDIPVIPVLVRSAKMPRPEELPDDLKNLAYRNAVELTHARWSSDLQLLIKALRPLVEPESILPPPPPKPAWPKFVFGALGVLVLAAVLFYFFRSSPDISVPDVRGSTLQEATTRLHASGLQLVKTTPQLDVGREANTVISQTPLPGTTVNKRTEIDLVVTPPLVKVPNLQDKSLEMARGILGDLQLLVGDVESVNSEGAPPNTVLHQFPSVGEEVKPGAKVNLQVSKARAGGLPQREQASGVMVPNMKGMTLAQARQVLASLGLSVGTTSSQEQAGVAPETVLSQSPNPGQDTPKNSAVNLVVSAASALKSMQVSMSATPTSVTAGRRARIEVTVKDPDGRPIPKALVVIRAGGGTFAGSNTSGMRDITDSKGVLGTTWTAPSPAASRYVLDVDVNSKGFSPGKAELTVSTTPSTGTSGQTLPRFAGTWKLFEYIHNGVSQPVSSRQMKIEQDGSSVAIGKLKLTIGKDGVATLRQYMVQDNNGRLRPGERGSDTAVTQTYTLRIDGETLIFEVVPFYVKSVHNHPKGSKELYVSKFRRISP